MEELLKSIFESTRDIRISSFPLDIHLIVSKLIKRTN
jgi:hypothetical protein